MPNNQVFTDVITHVKHKSTTTYGNPVYEVTTLNHGVFRTQANSSLGYCISNYMPSLVHRETFERAPQGSMFYWIGTFTINGRGTISNFEPTGVKLLMDRRS